MATPTTPACLPARRPATSYLPVYRLDLLLSVLSSPTSHHPAVGAHTPGYIWLGFSRCLRPSKLFHTSPAFGAHMPAYLSLGQLLSIFQLHTSLARSPHACLFTALSASIALGTDLYIFVYADSVCLFSFTSLVMDTQSRIKGYSQSYRSTVEPSLRFHKPSTDTPAFMGLVCFSVPRPCYKLAWTSLPIYLSACFYRYSQAQSHLDPAFTCLPTYCPTSDNVHKPYSTPSHRSHACLCTAQRLSISTTLI